MDEFKEKEELLKVFLDKLSGKPVRSCAVIIVSEDGSVTELIKGGTDIYGALDYARRKLFLRMLKVEEIRNKEEQAK